MTIQTLVSFVGTAVLTVVHSFLPVEERTVEPVNPQDAVRKAAATLKEIRVPGPHLCIIAHVFKVAGDTCDSAAVLKVAVAVLNAGAALEEIGLHSTLLSSVANACGDKVDLSEDQNNPISLFSDLYNNIWASEATALTEPTDSAPDAKEAVAAGKSEPADVLSSAAAFFDAVAMLEDIRVTAPVLSTVADVLNIAKDSSDAAAVLKAAAAVFYAVAREEVRASQDGLLHQLERIGWFKRNGPLRHLRPKRPMPLP